MVGTQAAQAAIGFLEKMGGKEGDEYLKGVEIAQQGEYQLVFTGMRLDQRELAVYGEILRRASLECGAEVFGVNASDLFGSLDWGAADADARKWLLETLFRLTASSLQVRAGKRVLLQCSMFPEVEGDERTGEVTISMPKSLRLKDGSWWLGPLRLR